MASLTYLITGATKGLGRGIVARLLLRNHITVVAAVRNTAHPLAVSLTELPRASTSRFILIQIDAASSTDPAAAIQRLERDHAITAIDVVIANAGIISGFRKVADATPDGMLEHYRINAVAPVLLFQATLSLLRHATRPRFIVTSGSGGSIARQDRIKMPLAEYGPSRAALNWLIRKIHFEEEPIAAVLLDPGLVATETGRQAVDLFGMDASLLQPVDTVVEKYLALVDDVHRDTHSGLFLNVADGSQIDW